MKKRQAPTATERARLCTLCNVLVQHAPNYDGAVGAYVGVVNTIGAIWGAQEAKAFVDGTQDSFDVALEGRPDMGHVTVPEQTLETHVAKDNRIDLMALEGLLKANRN